MLNKKKTGPRVERCGTAIISRSARSLPSNVSIGGNPKSSGFTLVEIIIVIVIIGIISGIAALIILQGVKAYSDENNRSDMHYQTRLAVERMAREIRLIRSQAVGDISIMNPADISFTDIQNNRVRFQLSAGTVRRSPDNGITWQTLSSGVQTLTFSYLKQDGVTVATAATLWFVAIDMTDQQGSETLQMRTRVHPMNF